MAAGRGSGRILLLLSILVIVPSALSELHNIIIVSRMGPGEVVLKCRILTRSETLIFKDFYLKPGVENEQIFTPGEWPYFIECYYGYQGNYASKVRLFDVSWNDASDCRVDRGGCLYTIEDSVLYKTTRSNGKRVVGELPVKQCKRFLGITIKCRQRPQHHYRVGEIIDFWEFYWARGDR